MTHAIKQRTLNYPPIFNSLSLLLIVITLATPRTTFAAEPFLDEFNGPELDPSWIIFDNEGDTQEGFTGDGQYAVVDSQSKADAGLGRSLSGAGDFTADVSIRLQDFFEGHADFKFRFLAPKFMELVFNSNDHIRVFSGERGGNTVQIPSFGYFDDSLMHIRFSWTESTGTMRIGVGLEDDPMQLITTIDGLTQFQPTRADLVLFRIGEGDHSPRLLLERFEIQEGALPIGTPPFVDDFSGPELAEGWTALDNEDGATQIGFSDGIYEIKDNQQGGDAGLRRSVGQMGSFTANARVILQDFAGSNTDFKFRFLGGKFMEVVYNSFDDIRVFSGEVGGNIGRFNKVGFQDGDVLDLKLAYDELTGTVQIGLAHNGGPMILLAEETELLEFTPNNVDLLLFKFGEGNGNAPRLQLDQFEISSGYLPVDVEPFLDEFDMAPLASAWSPIGPSDTQIGFNDEGQYQISANQATDPAGLKLRLPAPGSTTIDLTARFTEFAGSDSEFRMRLPGPGRIEIIVAGNGSLRVFSEDKGGDIATVDDFTISDGDSLDLRFAWDALDQTLEVGSGVNGDELELVVSAFDFEKLDPRALELALTSGGEQAASTWLDSVSVRQGFAQIPLERVEPFLDEFDGPDLLEDWVVIDDLGALGFANGAYQFSDPSRSSGNSGIQTSIIGEGSFTVDAHLTFDVFSGTGSDFKFRFFGGKFVEAVYNSFDDIRMHSGEKGAINRVNDIGIQDGEPVQLRFIWNEPLGQAQYGVSLDGETWTLVGSVSGLSEFKPTSVDMVMFKFGEGPEPEVSIDQFEIRPGVFEMPTEPKIQPFIDPFDGPELVEGWSLRDDSAEAQVGFGDGFYEIRDPSTSAAVAGLRRAFEGKGGSFTANLSLTLDAFAGSNSDFKFRFFGGQFIELVYNSFDDLRVFSQERGENVARIQAVGINDGDALNFRFIWDESGKQSIIGLAINNQPMMEIARVKDLQSFEPETVDFILFKFGEGNGQVPGMIIDSFEVLSEVVSIPEILPPVKQFADEFTGPDLDAGWAFRDESAEAQIGFNGLGQYQVNEPSTSANGDAGIRRSFSSGGSFTADLAFQFQDFLGSNSDFKFRFFGGKFIELVYNSFDDVRVFSGEKGGNVNRINKIGITDGVPLLIRFQWDAESGTASYHLSIDGGPMMEIATADGLKEFTPDTVDFVMFKFGEGNGNTPKLLLDRFEIRPGIEAPSVPMTPTSVEITGIEVTGDAVLSATITWASAAGQSYNVEWSENLVDWNELLNNVPSGGDQTSASEMAIPLDVPVRFYRVLTIGN